MATPIVAGVVALIIQRQVAAGNHWTPASIRAELLDKGIGALSDGPLVVGAGRVNMLNL